MTSGLQPYDQSVGIYELGDLWVMRKDGYRFRCVVFTHPLGWELRLMHVLDLLRSKVGRTQHEVFDIAYEWKTDHVGRGFTLEPPRIED